MSGQVRVELCHESGFGLIIVAVNEKQYRVDLMPGQVLRARELIENEPEGFAEYLVDIEPKFTGAIAAVGAVSIAQELMDKDLPKILQEMQKR